MTYGRSIFKALNKFNLNVERWPEGWLAADRSARACAWTTLGALERGCEGVRGPGGVVRGSEGLEGV